MKKVLFCANVYRHFTSFHMPYLYLLRDKGYKVYLLANDDYGKHKSLLLKEGFECIDIQNSRKPFSLKNFNNFLKIRKTLRSHDFKIVHVHTPIISFLTRIATFNINIDKIIYTAHGFHFYEGASEKNWLIYFTLEKIASKFTDIMVTINKEDYKNAKKYFSKDCNVVYIEGVGINTHHKKKSEEEIAEICKSLNVSKNDFVISYIAELNNNKNQLFLLKNWKEIKRLIPNAKLLLIGEGANKQKYLEYILDNNLNDISLLGFRKDIEDILQITDIVSLLSHREGLPKSIMEAMSFGIPCVVSNTRGLRDLISNYENGFVVDHLDDSNLIESFTKLYNNSILYNNFKLNALERIESYSYDSVMKKYKNIYES
ncbi:glycosyltransferase family 4 protein [Macrococcoides caseolyticum]|uniref:glycosyltransferase family 4 protein n=1 Tax=Macrococcoides caseolyticum TaxID=69966 RepID=UPI001166D783|nr:glycosyltransferase family 4 protein [Macrococcus caseolyticus]VUC67803.1 putative capsular polysaccharide biosynthesis protein [Macrococcus caseolyticus]